MRISRPCYDKPHRCPGWAGGGMKYPKRDRCDGGRVTVRVKHGEWNDHPGAHPLRFGRCGKCGVVTWPWFTRRLDPTWWPSKLRSWKWALEERRRWR